MESLSPQKIIAVVGATGAQGSSVVHTFHTLPSYNIRALTRSTSSEKAKALKAEYPNIELVAANLDDISTLEIAFKDVDIIFANTDFWSICVSENADKPLNGQPLNEWAYEQEIQQGRNILDVAAKMPKLERLIYSDLADTKKWSNGKYSYVLHFQSKAEILEYGQATYPNLHSKTSTIQLGFYLENWAGHLWLTPTKASDGIVEFSNFTSGGNPPFPLVAAKEDTGPLVAELVEQAAGKRVIAYRELVTLNEFVQRWSRITGMEARVGKPKDLGLSPELVREIDETMQFAVEFGYSGPDDTLLTPKQLSPELELGSVDEWIRGQDWSAILA